MLATGRFCVAHRGKYLRRSANNLVHLPTLDELFVTDTFQKTAKKTVRLDIQREIYTKIALHSRPLDLQPRGSRAPEGKAQE